MRETGVNEILGGLELGSLLARLLDEAFRPNRLGQSDPTSDPAAEMPRGGPIGILTATRIPASSLFASSVPRCSSTIRLTKVNPSPQPGAEVSCSCAR